MIIINAIQHTMALMLFRECESGIKLFFSKGFLHIVTSQFDGSIQRTLFKLLL